MHNGSHRDPAGTGSAHRSGTAILGVTTGRMPVVRHIMLLDYSAPYIRNQSQIPVKSL
ncbi:MAG TPA: hypothetical protein VGV68_07090 [Terriglobia bacterium]|nr:hypothetical protein [Terriglobia bacterium]